MAYLLKTLTKAAVEHFGTTDDVSESGYLTPDGRWLDLSGRHEASGYENGRPIRGDYLRGSRNYDHRQLGDTINEILDEEIGTPETSSERMRQFIEFGGMLRWSPESWGFSVYQPPTKAQLAEIVSRFRYDDRKPFFTVYGEFDQIEVSYPERIHEWSLWGIEQAIDRAFAVADGEGDFDDEE